MDDTRIEIEWLLHQPENKTNKQTSTHMIWQQDVFGDFFSLLVSVVLSEFKYQTTIHCNDDNDDYD